MRPLTITVGSIFTAALVCSLAVAQSQPGTKPKLYNTTKQKLLDGKQVFSFTQSKADPAGS